MDLLRIAPGGGSRGLVKEFIDRLAALALYIEISGFLVTLYEDSAPKKIVKPYLIHRILWKRSKNRLRLRSMKSSI